MCSNNFTGKKSNTTLVATLHGSKFCRLDEIIQYIFLPAWHGINFSKGPFYPSGKKLLWAKKYDVDAGTFDTVLVQRCIHACYISEIAKCLATKFFLVWNVLAWSSKEDHWEKLCYYFNIKTFRREF